MIHNHEIIIYILVLFLWRTLTNTRGLLRRARWRLAGEICESLQIPTQNRVIEQKGVGGREGENIDEKESSRNSRGGAGLSLSSLPVPEQPDPAGKWF